MAKYDAIILSIFNDKYTDGMNTIRFGREELSQKAAELGITPPKNLGDVVYSYKYRKLLPKEIVETAPLNSYWRIRNIGFGEYEFLLTNGIEFIKPDNMLRTIKISDSTPSIVRKYSMSDEQALLAIIRYNRLIDIFLGISCYSLQNHLRTTVRGVGQIEIDELYVGIDKAGRHYIIPVQAKAGSDKIGITQIEQDIALCYEKYPSLIYRSVGCQFMASDVVVLFEFVIEDGNIVKSSERHYKIVDANSISPDDLNSNTLHLDS